MSFLRSLLIACTLSASLHAAEDKMRLVRETVALTPEQERTGLHVPPGFTVQLFASEPMINKPINMAFDARGRLWVSSTVEYPYSADKSRWSDEKGTRVKDSRDAIKILADTNGDGKADKVTDFADGLNIPTGVLPWHKPEHKAGCIAWSIPNIWYFADTDGDDKADHREILFGPLGYEKDTHGMCSSFRLGLDGWVYATHGFNNTSHFKAKDGSTLDLHSGNVFRFRPDGSRIEKWTSGQVNPFGLCWDRFGNLYSADCHSSPIYQLIRGACYPSFGKPDDGLGFAPEMCEHSHGSTGICGIVYVDGGVWGPEWDDHMFVGNCVTSRVNHDKVSFNGSTPKANEQPDFITSDDPWFRPVDLQLGPDNALYIADFYNRIIGHYEVPLDHPGRDKERGRIWRVVKKDCKLALRDTDLSGASLDRLVDTMNSANLTQRILSSRAAVVLLQKDCRSLIASLDKEHRHRHTFAVQQLMWVLAQRGAYLDRNAISSPIKEMDNPLLALGTTDDFLEASANDVLAFLYEQDEGLHFKLASDGMDLKDRPANKQIKDARVQRAEANMERFYIRGYFSSAYVDAGIHIAKLFGQLECADPADVSLRHLLRVIIRERLREKGAFDHELDPLRFPTAQSENHFAEIVQAVGGPGAARWLFDFLQRSANRQGTTVQTLSAIARGAEPDVMGKLVTFVRESEPGTGVSKLESFKAIYEGRMEGGLPMTPSFISWGTQLAESLLADASQTETQWQTLSHPDYLNGSSPWCLQDRKCSDGTVAKVVSSLDQSQKSAEKLTGILRSKTFAAPDKLAFWVCGHRGNPQQPVHDKNLVRLICEGKTVQQAFPPRSDVCQRIEWDLSAIKGKPVQLEIVDGDNGPSYAWLGVTRIEPAVVNIESFQSDDQKQKQLRTFAMMLQHTAPAALREKLVAYLPPRPAPPPLPVSPEQRKQLDVLIAARAAAFGKAKPDVVAGKAVFTTNCAVCHQIRGDGNLIGPQLDGIGARGAERLSEDILDPNRNVDAHFHLHTLTLKDGSSLSGFLKGEVGQVLILADAAGQEHRVSKNDLAKDVTTPMSLMPPVFGQTLDEKTFINLLGYLMNEKARE